MTKATTYTATYNGQVVGTRKSPRVYLFAVVYQRDEAKSRAFITRPADKTDRANFEYYVKCATGTYVGTFANGKTFTTEIKGDELARAQAHIVGGFEAYVARIRADSLAAHEAAVANGDFEPCVFGWSMSARAVKGMEAQAAKAGHYLATVPAVAV
jgi:hypothetical protein